MQWLDTIVKDIIAQQPEGEILIESGGSPSGTYHLGHLRELIICDAILLELTRKKRQSKHVYFVDDLDALRKVPADIPSSYDQYLGIPLCDIPAPDGSEMSYADFHIHKLADACDLLGIDVEFIRSHEKYRSGYFVPVIERCLERVDKIRSILEEISNRKLPDNWTPIQVMDNGRLKNRSFVSINVQGKTITYIAQDGSEKSVSYEKGEVKMDWRLDWPGRWWMMKVGIEPFGREHASAGGSYETGAHMMKDIYEAPAPLPVPYDSIHMVGDTKKMSASKGTALSVNQGLELLPSEIIRYFMLRNPLNRPVYFDPVNGVVQLIDEFASLSAQTTRNQSDEQLYYVCTRGIDKKTVSKVPFSLLVASYQAALFDEDKTLEIIGRTEYKNSSIEDGEVIKTELHFIRNWLDKYAPDDIKFQRRPVIDKNIFSENEKRFFEKLAESIAKAPQEADGAWFHQAIYESKDEFEMQPKDAFKSLYTLIIGKNSGPRAGWFLSILPRNWLLKRLRLEE